MDGQKRIKGRGYFYQMSNMYTCIAYLIENTKFYSKTWFIKVLILIEAQNLLNSPTSIFNFKKNSGGYTPGPPLKEGGERGRRRRGQGTGAPPL